MQNASDWELIDDGSFNGLRKWMRASDENEGTVQVKYEGVGDEQIIDENRRAETHKVSKDMWHVAHIPAKVGMDWLIHEGIDMWSSDPDMRKRVLRKALDSDYRHCVPGFNRIIL